MYSDYQSSQILAFSKKIPIATVQQQSCGKVMFSQVSVILFR